MEKLVTHWITNKNNRIFIREWKVSEPIKGVIHLMHGMMEHSGFYNDWAIKLNKLGWVVIIHDHPGSGLTVYENTAVDQLPKNSNTLLVSIVDRVDQWIRKNYPKKKLVRYGHSMGAFIAINAEQSIRPCHGLILTGLTSHSRWQVRLQTILLNTITTIVSKNRLAKLPLMMTFGTFNRQFKPNKTRFDWLSQSEKTVEKYMNDQKCGNIPNWGYFQTVNKLIAGLNKKQLYNKLSRTLPILILSGEDDPLSDGGKKIRPLVKMIVASGIKNVKHHILTGARHKIEYDTNEKDHLDIIRKWLNKV